MATQWNKGDTVQLKSGGPIMTVTKIAEFQGDASVHCVWFEGTKTITGSFPPEALIPEPDYSDETGIVA